MIVREVVVPNRLGLHARAAAKFVQMATRFHSRILVRRDSRTMDGKSIMGVLLLAAARGTTIAISADGPDESDAVGALVQLVETGFGEDPWNG
jgi:phosphotransferase system HPr (HPr) family protein